MAKGRAYLVGAGPGDPGLITLRGVEALQQADVVLYDALSCPRLLEHAPPSAELIYVGKQAGKHTLCQDEINELLVARVQAGSVVVRLKGGDPFVFGRGGEEALALADAGLDFDVVPGITAGLAGPAYAGIPVTHRHMAVSLALITGHEAPGKEQSDLDFDALAAWGGTLVFYMGVKNLPRICEELVSHGLAFDTPAAVIRWAATPRQEVVTSTLGELPDAVEAAGIKPPAIIVVGKVVSLRDKLRWFERRGLFGRRIVVTRARPQASDLTARIEALGAEVIEMPTIRIAPPADPGPLDRAAGEIATFDWIVFTSANGVDALFEALGRSGLDARALSGVKVASIGPATAKRLADRGIRADAQPAKFVSTEIADTLAAAGPLDGSRILCPRADIAPKGLVLDLESRGAEVRDVAAYATAPDAAGSDLVLEMLGRDELHWITFTSSSTVKNFFAAVDAGRVRAASVRLASIGPVTSETIRSFELNPSVEAESHTIAGLVEAILVKEQAEARS